MAFNAKNLNYERKDPPFLQKLRGTYGSRDVPQQRFSQRPRKPKYEDDDDAPTYVDGETSESISKEEYEALVRGDEKGRLAENGKPSQDEHEQQNSRNSANYEAPKSQQKMAEIGGQKKRKQIKVVKDKGPSKEEKEDVVQDNGAIPKKQKQGKKKIKLSFDDGEQ